MVTGNEVQVHHKIPVHVLTKDNIMLIWDFDNLIALCRKCHGNSHAMLNQQRKKELVKRKYITLDKFFFLK